MDRIINRLQEHIEFLNRTSYKLAQDGILYDLTYDLQNSPIFESDLNKNNFGYKY